MPVCSTFEKIRALQSRFAIRPFGVASVLFFGTFALVLGFLTACDDSANCSTAEPVTPFIVAFEYGDTTRTLFDSVYTIRRRGSILTRTVFVKNALQKSIALPLYLNEDTITFHIAHRLKNRTIRVQQRISIKYRHRYELLSPACDPRINFDQFTLGDTLFSTSLRPNEKILSGNTSTIYAK